MGPLVDMSSVLRSRGVGIHHVIKDVRQFADFDLPGCLGQPLDIGRFALFFRQAQQLGLTPGWRPIRFREPFDWERVPAPATQARRAVE